MIAELTHSFVFVSEDADICGVDEAGRGPLAGPVVAAAVVLDLLAMERAVVRLDLIPELVRVDGRQIPAFHDRARAYRAEPIIDGDNLVPEISAASILAKLCRDRLMRRLHRRYPQYGSDQSKGYATAEHLRALEKFGPCAIHRATFAPVREVGAEHAR